MLVSEAGRCLSLQDALGLLEVFLADFAGRQSTPEYIQGVIFPARAKA